MWLCPVRALQSLLSSRQLPLHHPLFAHKFFPHLPVIDTHIRDVLRDILARIGLPTAGLGFHAFRRSGATLAFDNNVALEDIMAHGLWRSSAVWIYLQGASKASSRVPSAFASLIPPSLS